jgi:ketosteroid isomerase-like protein
MATRSTRDVIDSHLRSFGERSLDGILSDYAPDAVLFTPQGPLRGVEAIKPLFQAMLAEFGKPGARFSLNHLSVEGDHAYIVWAAETADNVYELGTDTFVVRDGRIAVQSFAGHTRSKISPPSAARASPRPGD